MWHFHPEAAYSPLLISSLFPPFSYVCLLPSSIVLKCSHNLYEISYCSCELKTAFSVIALKFMDFETTSALRELKEKKNPNSSTSWTKKRFSCIFHLFFFFQWSLPVSPFFLAWSKHIKYALLQGFHWENLVAGYSPQLYKKYPRPPKFSSENLQSNKEIL